MSGGDSAPRSVRSPRRLLAAGLVLAVAIAGCSVLVFLRSDDDRRGEVVAVTIPAGTKASIARGEPGAGVPRRIEGHVGDTLRIINRDRSLHVVGGFPVAAGQTLEVPLRTAGVTEGMCTAHPDEKVAIVVRPA